MSGGQLYSVRLTAEVGLELFIWAEDDTEALAAALQQYEKGEGVKVRYDNIVATDVAEVSDEAAE